MRASGAGAAPFLILCALLAAAAGDLRAELPGPPPPWVPEGYTFLSFEETFRMSRAGGEEGKRLGQINSRNQAVLEAALGKMNAAELEALQTKLRAYYKEAQAPEWKNFAMAAGARAAERLRLLRSRRPSSFDAILQEQETGTSGFPDDADAVSREAERIEQLIGKQPSSDLYLAVLKPLRARPWNDDARHALHKIVKEDQPEFPADRGKVLTLQMAALEFVRRRELEQPDQGAWTSLEATLRDLPEQPGGAYWSREAAEQARDARFRPLRALWERAIALQARDNDTHAMAVILARLDGDAEKEAEAMAWNARDGLEREEIETNVRLVGDWYLTPGLRQRLYKLTSSKPGGDTDWPGRLETLETSPNYDLVISETSAILDLPGPFLPQPYRAEFLSLNLERRVHGGHMERPGFCDELAKQLPTLEAQAAAAYPPAADSHLPPPPHHLGEVAQLRQEVMDLKKELEGSAQAGATAPALTKQQEEERAQFRGELEREMREAERTLAGKDDASVLADWNRRELADWRQAHLRKQGKRMVLPLGEAERLTLPVRAALADCYRDEQRFDEAAALVDRCLLPRAEVDSPCVVALANVGSALAGQNRLKEAVAVYRQLASAGVDPQFLESLKSTINSAAPGTL